MSQKKIRNLHSRGQLNAIIKKLTAEKVRNDNDVAEALDHLRGMFDYQQGQLDALKKELDKVKGGCKCKG